MKHEWKKNEKGVYLPKNRPEKIIVPEFKFYSIKGKGNPNDDFFSEYIGVLYSLSYAIKMCPKQGIAPNNYYEYTVYPLEGVWDIDENAKKNFDGTIDKNTLVFNLMIRQPDFVTSDFANEIIDRTKKKKPHELLDSVKFEIIEEGCCIQMLHLGSYDSEPESFKKMELYAQEQNLRRKTHTHREIYLSDARKVEPEKLKTVLRFQVE
ncbi:MAG: GyrI-like domain-containing protein [Bacteroidales bacterium]|nr:GyrI-like domain-containing protein [Bacteroidales bacterium]